MIFVSSSHKSSALEGGGNPHREDFLLHVVKHSLHEKIYDDEVLTSSHNNEATCPHTEQHGSRTKHPKIRVAKRKVA